MFRLLKSIFQLIFLAVEMVFIALFVLAKFVYYKLEKTLEKPLARKTALFLVFSVPLFIVWIVWCANSTGIDSQIPHWTRIAILAMISGVFLGIIYYFQILLPERCSDQKKLGR